MENNHNINGFLDCIFRKEINSTISDVSPSLTKHLAAGNIESNNALEIFKELESLAKFHAASIAFEELKSVEFGRKYELNEEFGDNFFDANTETIGHKYVKSCELGALKLINLIYTDKSDQYKTKMQEFTNKLFKIFNKANNYRKVLSHVDLSGFNNLFESKSIDLQLIRYAPPAHDVTLFLYFNARELFQEEIHNFYNHYYNKLEKELNYLNLNIAKILTKDEFEDTCKIYMPIAKFIYLGNRQISLATIDISETILLGDDRVKFIQENYNTDENYRSKLNQILNDNINSILNDCVSIEEAYNIIEAKIGSKNYKLIKLNLKQLAGFGFLGEYCSLNIKILRKEEENLNYFIKLVPNSESRLHFVNITGALFKEINFFNVILPDFIKHGVNIVKDISPSCYLANSHMIIMDDLSAKNFTGVSARESLNLMQIKLALKSLAKLHASGIIYEEKIKEATGTVLKLNEMYPEYFKETFYSYVKEARDILVAAKYGVQVQIELFSNHTSNITPEQFKNLAFKLIDAYPEFVKPNGDFRNTICHGDLWSGNLMFGDDECIFVDFQSYRYKPPAQDLMGLLYLTTDRAFRAAHLEDSLDFYYEEFSKVIEAHGYETDAILSYVQFKASTKAEHNLAVAQAVTHFQNIMVSKEVMKERLDDEEFLNHSLYVDRSQLVRSITAIDEVYRRRTRESILDLREICEKIAEENVSN